MPVGTVAVGQPPGELLAIATLARERGVAIVVLGLPLTMAGEHGTAPRKAEAFADALRTAVTVPVELHDERLSTVEAERALAAAGTRGRERRRVVDATAAAVILQAWLDAHRATGEGRPAGILRPDVRSEPPAEVRGRRPRRLSLLIALALFLGVVGVGAWGANYYRRCQEPPTARPDP